MRNALRVAYPSFTLIGGVGIACAFLLTILAPVAAQPAQMQGERVAVGDEAIDFTLMSTDGESFTLSELRGDKNVVVIFFRGTW